MPVTKCEPEPTRKASRKSAKTQETVLSALLAQTEEVSVPLASLIKSPLNVRTVPYSAESVSELAESIKGVGLLQNLVVHALPGDRYGVAAGGRRLACPLYTSPNPRDRPLSRRPASAGKKKKLKTLDNKLPPLTSIINFSCTS
ncbi:ParB/Srx family N-terminal domain-containing protein, partial [Salmonella enterica]|uniref:ParB/Srx family N-terminal domain-containing protein n=1 Tax=Salmonella enterica TaxID=28901 RepID=UPI002159C763